MHLIEILRISSSMVTGTRGIMMVDRAPFLVTLELPWKMNIPFKSCIPVGEYICKRYKSDRYKHTFIIENVTNRDRVLFHVGNFLEDTDGCICIGLSFGEVGESALIRDSRIAFKRFMRILSDVMEFSLVIRNVF